MATARVYLDANIALHYQPLEQLDWRAIVDRDQVVVVITSVFLREIDLNKDSKRGHIQKRARRVNSWLGEVRKNKTKALSPGIALKVIADEPEVDVNFEDHGLAPSSNDDKFVACMLRDRVTYPDAEFICVTADSALAYKADAKGFLVVEVPDSYRLQPEPDDKELENRELRKQLVAFQNRVEPAPRLRIASTGDESYSVFAARIVDPIADEDIQDYIQLQKSMIELGSNVLLGALYTPPSKASIGGYVNLLVEWLHWYNVDAIARGLTCRMKLVLKNDGNGNAIDMELRFRFPASVFVAKERVYQSGPTRPRMPRGRSMIDAYTERLNTAVFAPSVVGLRNLLGRETYEPVRIVESENEHELVIHVASIKHRSEVALPEFDAWFSSAEELPTNGFQVECQIHVGLPPDLQEQQIDVNVSLDQCAVGIPDDDSELTEGDDK
jgi:hypothetical protein